MPTSKEAAAAAAATAATDALAGQAAVAAQQAILARQAAAAAAQRAEFTYIAGLPPNRRTVAQNTRLAVFLGNAPRTQQAGPTALHALSTAVHVMEVPRGGTVYRMNDPSDGFYLVVDGRVVLYDVKDKDEAEEDDGVVERLGRTDSFGEEDLLSNSRRAHRADVSCDCPSSSALLIRVPPELYRKYLQHLHAPDFEDKVDFLAQLEVFRSLPDETLRKLAPCFAQVELRAREYLVRQGERADSMYAIATGQCSVLVDPHFRAEAGGAAESDPKKAMQVCLIGPGNIVGDMTVLANVRKRTASILCLTDLICYKIRRATFIRRVPSIQLEALRQVAEAKLRITERHLHHAVNGTGSRTSSGGGAGGGKGAVTLRDKLLRGHELRQLFQPAPGVGPLELRNLAPGALSSNGVETLIANSLAASAAAAAAVAAAAAAAAAAPASGGGGGGLAAAASAAVASMTGGSAAAAAATVMADARMRFGGSRKPALSPRGVALTQGGGGGGGIGAMSALSMDRTAAAPPAVKIRGRPLGPSGTPLHPGDKVRTTDINFSWGLGPGTLINSLLERPATVSGAAGSTAAATGTSATAAGGISLHRIFPNEDTAAATPQDATAAAAGSGGGGGGSVFVPAPPPPPLPLPPPLPSAASPQLQPTSSRLTIQHLSFNYGRSGGGFGGAGLRGSTSSLALSQPRWGWTSAPIDTAYSPYTAPASFPVGSGGSADAGMAISVVGVSLNNSGGGAGGGPSGASGGGGGGVIGAVPGVNTGGGFGGAGLCRGGLRSAHQSNSATLPYIAGDRLAAVYETSRTGRRSFSGAYATGAYTGGGGGVPQVSLHRPGPLIIGPAAPAGIPPPPTPPAQQPTLMQLLLPTPQQSPSPSTSPPTAWAPQQQQQQQQSQTPQRPCSVNGDGDAAAAAPNGQPGDLAATPSGFASPSAFAAATAGPDPPWSPASRGGGSGVSSPARSRYGDAALPLDQRWGSGVSAAVSAGAGTAPGGDDEPQVADAAGYGGGSDGEALTPTRSRREAIRRQKSTGKARFSRKLVTQNSSVDALVAEAIVSVLAKDVLLRQARAAAAEEEEEEEEEAEAEAVEAAAATAGRGAATAVAVVGPGELPTGEVEAGRVGVGGGVEGGTGAQEPGSPSPEGADADSAGRAGELVGGEVEAAGGCGEAAEGRADDGEDGVGVSRAVEGEGERSAAEYAGGDAAPEGTMDIEAEAAGDEAAGTGGAAEDGVVADAEGGAAQSGAAAETEAEDGTSEPAAPEGAGHPPAPSTAKNDVEAGDWPEAGTAAQARVEAEADGEASPEPSAAKQDGEGGAGNGACDSADALPRPASAAGPEVSRLSEGSVASLDCTTPQRHREPPLLLPDPTATPPAADGHSEPAALQRPPSLTHSGPSSDASRPTSGVATVAHAAAAADGQPPPHPHPHTRPPGRRGSGGGGADANGGGGGNPRPVSRAPTTLQLSLPGSLGLPSGRQAGGGMAPARRQVAPPVAPRPYPYVGPFLSLKKAPPLAAAALLTVTQTPAITPPTKLPSFNLRTASTASAGAAAAAAAAPSAGTSPAAAAGAATSAGERSGGGGESSRQVRAASGALEGGGGAAAPVGGGAGGFHTGGGSSGTRGHLRKGGTLYRSPTSTSTRG